jgi:imidazolonepropionase-like amidohydrolase
MRSFVLREAFVLDETGHFGGPTDVLVDGNRLVEVGRNLSAPEARSIDASGLWIMPGVFDCHAHPAMWSRNLAELLRTPITAWALTAASMLRDTLLGGVTYVRDAGGVDQGLRMAIERGEATGPRLQLTIVLLSQTGGQMDGFLAGPGIEMPTNYLLPDYPGRPPYRVDGVDEMRRAVRSVIRAGGDWIKIVAGSGLHVEGQDWDQFEYSSDEVAIAVAEASRAGREVMCDVKTPAGIEMCVEAGARSIEHGLFLDEERAALMASNAVWLVPTFSVYEDLVRRSAEEELTADMTRVLNDMMERSKDRLRIALEAGVSVALGSDAYGREMHGANLAELWYMSEAGMDAPEVLLAATAHGAKLCGVSDNYGRLAPGYVFDAIVLDADPSDLRVFRTEDAARAVFKGGVLQASYPRLNELNSRRQANDDDE